jgi:hypothetical protein
VAGNSDRVFMHITIICLLFAIGWGSMVVGLYVVDDLSVLGIGYLGLGAGLGAAGAVLCYYALGRWRALLAAEPVVMAGKENLLTWLLAPVLILGLLFVLWTAVDLSPVVIGLLVLAAALFGGAFYLWKNAPAEGAGDEQELR